MFSARTRHLKELASRLDCAITIHADGGFDDPEHGMLVDGGYHPVLHSVRLSGYQDTLYDYFTGLHELGHAALHRGKCPVGLPWETKLRQEIEAWEWAFFHTAEQADARTKLLVVQDALMSYAVSVEPKDPVIDRMVEFIRNRLL